MKKAIYIIYSWLFATLAVSCIENDIPYPLVEGSITAFEVEGMCDADGNAGGTATINKQARTVTVNVDDRVNPAKLRISRLQVTNDAAVSLLDSAKSVDYAMFPRHGFASLNELGATANTRIDFTQPVRFRLTTYQDYDWTVTVNHIFEQDIQLEGQIGDAVIDNENKKVVVYVSNRMDFQHIRVHAFSLGGTHGTVIPDPTTYPDFDFTTVVRFYVSRAWEESSTEWKVYVYPREGEATATSTAQAAPMSSRANISGTIGRGQSLAVEYKPQNASEWTRLDDSHIQINGTKFTATLPQLSPSADYNWRTLVDGNVASEGSFRTAAAPQLTDGDFDNWNLVGNRWDPWANGGTSFWDTGNKGATTVGNSNSVPTDETCNGHGKAAFLESKYIVMKFAAGNIFTGQYVKTDGANGVLDFGRPFTGFPTKLRVNYKYTCSTINRCGDSDYEYLKGRPDTAQIYIALADWEEPFRIRTRPSERSLFSADDPHVIAYAQISVGHDVPDWRQEDLELKYKYTDRTPRYILVVASASKFGDFFTGGDGSKLWIDNFELIYD